MTSLLGFSCAGPVSREVYSARPDVLTVRRPARTASTTLAEPTRVVMVAAVPGAASEDVKHVVSRGETLSAIARTRYGDASKWTAIAAANPRIDPNRLMVGTTLVLP